MNFGSKFQLMLIVIFYSCNIVKANWLELILYYTLELIRVDTLNSCKNCSTQNECITCANDHSHIQCSKCYTDVFHENILNCDHKQSKVFQNLACGVKCRVKNSLEGICISKNGECTCGTHDFILLQLNESIFSDLRDFFILNYIGIILSIVPILFLLLLLLIDSCC